mmetsp:Transcript_71580/g.132110  ORF Transcript_71580/g.132110 Transcript_71580/m.132110 type:complete len:714 (+) Transcript_71580:68-2209(+)
MSLTAHKIALLLLGYLTCTCHGRRVQPTNERVAKESPAALATLLLSALKPAGAFNPAAAGTRLPASAPALAKLHPPGVARIRSQGDHVLMADSASATKANTKVEGDGYGVYDPSRIRNFCIVAHIDHGKSTLADRLLQTTKTVEERKMKEQLLDNMDIERERGITIKLQAARMNYLAKDGKWYVLNLIDTPGHVDFTYEVSRSLAACEGAILVVDAAQGVEAQTIANVYLALDNNLEIVPVLNKIDLPGADPDNAAEEVESTIGLDCSDAILASAKKGVGIEETLEAIVQKIPPPPANLEKPPRALIFDSYYDPYKGVICFIRVVDGELKKKDMIRFVNTGKQYELLEVGTLAPGQQTPVEVLRAGEVGYLQAGIKSVADARVGDTIILNQDSETVEALGGYKEPTPVVYCGLFPTDANQLNALRDALEKLQTNDAALDFVSESSDAMGFGFRCGFLGLLHMEIVQERLEREYDLDLIMTAPSVVYHVIQKDGEEVSVESPGKLPDPGVAKAVEEPYVRMEMFSPVEYSGKLMELAQNKRGEHVGMDYLTEKRVSIKYDMPLAEVITDFFDELKSRSQGYASMEYHVTGYRPNDLVRLDIRINGEPAQPLSTIVHMDDAQRIGRSLTRKLKDLIPRQQFKVPIQAVLGNKPIASCSISAVRKDVLAKCYGGDISRKLKLLKAQAKGKKRMKEIGRVAVPQEAFMAVLNIREEK